MTLETWQQWEGRVLGGRYVLRQYLGGSDHSAVYLTDFDGSRAVAKLVPADLPDAAAHLARWEAACNLAHPSLLRVYETGRWHADDERDMLFAVMEFADESLGEVLSDRPLTPTEAREMLVPTLAALEYLHSRNLVHGCLKPSNVMAVGPQLKLALDGVRRSGTRLTSIEQEDWRAVPEVFNAGVSWRNDVWTLGLLLVESLMRQKTKLEKNGEIAIQLPDDLPEPIRSIARECLQRDPAKRCSIPEIRCMLERPIESAKAPAPVVPIRQGGERDWESQEEASAPQLPPEQPVRSHSTQAVSLKSLLYESEPPERRNLRFVPLAVAILVAIIAIFALVRFAEWHASEAKPQTEAAAPAVSAVAVQPAVAPTVNSPARSVSGAVAKQVMPQVSRVAQNTIHGVVKVRVQVNVNEAGEVTLAGLAAHGPSRYFARQALDAARQWSFAAPVVDGKAVASRWIIEFDFRRSGIKTESWMIQPRA
jgi:TonB family protein